MIDYNQHLDPRTTRELLHQTHTHVPVSQFLIYTTVFPE